MVVNFIRNIRRYIYLRRWQANGKGWRENSRTLMYHVWKSGYISGKINADEGEAWTELSKTLKLKEGENV